VIAIVSAIGLLQIAWYGWYLFLFSNFTVAYQTAVVLAYYSKSEFKFLTFIFTLLLQAVAISLVARRVRVPYFIPRIRWWESDPRYKLSVRVQVVRPDASTFEGEILDFSSRGCFIKTQVYFTVEEKIDLSFSLFDYPIHCKGQVVWKAESRVTHPKGIGVKFFQLDKDTKSYLKKATVKTKKLTRIYNQMTREKNWQEYLRRENSYQGKITDKISRHDPSKT
jgi:Tfp pilus assembly protein PilZ